MIGFLIGLACGAGELYLLTLLTRAVQKERAGAIPLIVLAKLALLAAAFVPVIVFARNELLWCGVGMTAVLIVGAFILNMRAQKGRRDP